MFRRGLLIVLFLMGMALGSFVTSSYYINQTSEQPYSLIAPELASPADHIPEEDIHVYSNRVVIDIQSPVWAKFTDTNSMDPIIDEGANAIQIIPKNKEEISVGDIVSYESTYAPGITIHRVVDIQEDEEGTYFVLKGDNNPEVDPGKVRFDQIRKVLVGVIY